MKILTILGSPKKKGNTGTVLSMFEEQAKATGHDIDRVNLADAKVGGCMGCYACQQNPDEPACVQPDDMQGIYDRILAADAVVYASPLYMWGFASGIRGLMERHLALVTGYMSPKYKSLLKGKKAALLATSGGPVEGNAELMQGVFDRFAAYAQYDNAGKFMVPTCTTPDALGSDAEGVARKMVGALTGA
jgi:multimeric flavodoxin WrbA